MADFGTLYLYELSHGLANLSMFPYFDMAHYIVSIMALREQAGALQVSRASPLACWVSSMLYCFGGAVLSGIMLAEPPVAPLTNSTNILLASAVWYLIFYSPMDMVYSCAATFPLRMVLTGMKEMTRTWKILGGVTQANNKYKDNLLVMIAIGWARGAGGGLISNFEQLVRGVWKPETNELLNMSYPTKITLIGAVLFALQQTHYLPIQKQNLMLFYTIFIVVNKSRMMVTGSSSSPFAPIESVLHKTLFMPKSPYIALPAEEPGVKKDRIEVRKESTDNCDVKRTITRCPPYEARMNRPSGESKAVCTARRSSSCLEAKEEGKKSETTKQLFNSK